MPFTVPKPRCSSWSRPIVDSFEVYKSTGLLGTDDKPPYAYIETIDVNDMDKFGGEVSTETMQAIAGEFQAMADDLVFIMTDKLG